MSEIKRLSVSMMTNECLFVLRNILGRDRIIPFPEGSDPSRQEHDTSLLTEPTTLIEKVAYGDKADRNIDDFSEKVLEPAIKSLVERIPASADVAFENIPFPTDCKDYIAAYSALDRSGGAVSCYQKNPLSLEVLIRFRIKKEHAVAA